MKKTCNGCRALIIGQRCMSSGCGLNYKNKDVFGTGGYLGLRVDIIPQEECPKPKTNTEYMSCLKK